MQFFPYEIVARIVAIYLGSDCSRKLWHGLVEGKIGYFQPDFLSWWSGVADRDATPVQYWIQIGFRILILICMPLCCDIRAVAAKYLSVGQCPSAHRIGGLRFANPPCVLPAVRDLHWQRRCRSISPTVRLRWSVAAGATRRLLLPLIASGGYASQIRPTC
jgi:hypothetical protein